MKSTHYTKDYFINKFSAIPDEKWTTGDLTKPGTEDCHCAMGHCGYFNYQDSIPEEVVQLANILTPLTDGFEIREKIYKINDGFNERGFSELGSTPKERMLNALKLI